MNHPTPASPLVGAHNCHQLRHKGMYVLSVPEPTQFHDPYDATVFWCIKTQKAIGPDGGRVHADLCRAGRDCCK
jgi:hypothetical protein